VCSLYLPYHWIFLIKCLRVSEVTEVPTSSHVWVDIWTALGPFREVGGSFINIFEQVGSFETMSGLTRADRSALWRLVFWKLCGRELYGLVFALWWGSVYQVLGGVFYFIIFWTGYSPRLVVMLKIHLSPSWWVLSLMSANVSAV